MLSQKNLVKLLLLYIQKDNDSIIKKTEVTVGKPISGDPPASVVNTTTKYTLTLKPEVLTLGVNKSASIQPTLTPKRSSETLKWESSDETVAKVYIPACSDNYIDRCKASAFYMDGSIKMCTGCVGIRQARIVGLKKGTATLTLTASPSGAKTTIKVIVN
jgi:hypothetical protein